MKTFCPLPWNGVSVRNNGDLRVCCNANSYTKNQGILRKKDGTPYNIGRDDVKESRNSDVLKDVRATMMRGEWHEECTRCRLEEETGIRSRREYENQTWPEARHHAFDNTEEDGTIDTKEVNLDYFDLRYGNMCNLKCRMCGPTDSHMWYEEYVATTGHTGFTDSHGRVQLQKNEKGKWSTGDYDWFKDSNFYWDQFAKHTKDAKKIYISGGEPLMIQEHIESLERLVESGKASQLEIEYNTNMTNVTDRVIDIWKNFKVIRVGSSIDGFGDVFEYQRHPADWNTVFRNLTKLDTTPGLKMTGWFAYTVTPINILHLPEFMKWKLTESKLKKFNAIDHGRKIVSHHMCHRPKHYNVKCLPDGFKKIVDKKFAEYKEWAVNNTSEIISSQFVSILDGVSTFMNAESYHDEYFPTFVSLTKKLDELRDQNILDVVPEFEEYFK
jgi:MoaA/NifB/PqqE/SkfB family radical SAM enzyme